MGCRCILFGDGRKTHTDIPALPFCHSTLTASRPRISAYSRELKTLGDHIRKKRLDLGLLEKEVAQRLGVGKDSVYYWETNRYSPSLRFVPRIIRFLGYLPYDTSNITLGERLITMRRCLGLSREGFAEQLGVDESTLRDWENGRRRPLRRNMRRLDEMFNAPLLGQVLHHSQTSHIQAM